MNKARYIRISSPDQKIERQLIKSHPDELIYIEKCSGVIPFAEREQAKKLLKDIESKGITYITADAIDRLGRDVVDLLQTLDYFTKRNITLKVDNLGIESIVNNKPNEIFKMIISVLGNVAEMERNNMLERQKKGIEIAKAKGIYKGRVRGSKESKEDFLNKHKAVVKYLSQNQSIRNTAKLTNTSPATVQKVKSLI